MGRAPCCDKENVKRGPWSPEEDAKLKAYIAEHGTGGNWIALPHKIGLKRCGKSCRLRWLNYLRPNIKHGGFTEEEDQIICNLYISIGSRWSIIAAQLPGRTDNDIKNYWNTRLKKKLFGQRTERPSQPRSLQVATEESHVVPAPPSHQTLSASALERMQLYLQLQGLCNAGTFSFYNQPSLWPNKFPSLLASDQMAVQSQGNASNKLMAMMMMTTTTSANYITEEEIDFSGLGFHHSPSRTGPALSMETSSSNLESANAARSGGLQADHLHGLAYCRNPSFLGHEESHLADLDFYKEIYGEKENESSSAANNWWNDSNNVNGGFDQESSAASAHLINADHSSMIQEYANYDL